MAICSTNKKFHEILALLGIDVEGATKIVITAEVHEVVKVEITRWVETKEGDEVPSQQVFKLEPFTAEDEINTEIKDTGFEPGATRYNPEPTPAKRKYE